MKVQFNIPPVTGRENEYIGEVFEHKRFCGNGNFTHKCQKWFENTFCCKKAYLTTSCTHALEICAFLLDLKEGDEVIMPSFTFVTTATSFVIRGAKPVFVDIRQDTLNIDQKLIEAAITEKTKAIVVVHYAGIASEMNEIMKIADKYNLVVIEDAAQAVNAKYNDKFLGTIGHLACYSFHETKNYTCGEGGALIVNDEKFIERAEIIREKGTDRSRFFRGQVDKYTWIDLGSSYEPGELSAAFLYAQLEEADTINKDRIKIWNQYFDSLKALEEREYFKLPVIPDGCEHNAHTFYLLLPDLEKRTSLLKHLREKEIGACFHYIPLHSSTAGLKYGRFNGEDNFTTNISEKILRLPLYYGLEPDKVNYVIDSIREYYSFSRY